MPAFPSTLYPVSVKAVHRRKQARAESPYNFSPQIHDWMADRWEISIVLATLNRADADVLGQWLESLNGMVGTFTFDLNPWVSGTTPGTRTFRLSAPLAAWDANYMEVFEAFQIDAIEAL